MVQLLTVTCSSEQLLVGEERYVTTLTMAAKETNKSGAGFSKSRNFLSLILGATIPFIIIIFAIPMLQAIKL